MKSRLPKGYGGGGNMNQMAKRLQDMQAQIQEKTEEINGTEFHSSVGGGVVQATVNGKKEVVSLQVKPEAVDPDDVEMLQDLIIGAINEALRQVDDMTEKEMDQITGGMAMPGMM